MQIGLFGILTIIFVVCKLAHVIDWSWWLVLAPMWGGILFVLIFALVVFAIAVWAQR